MRRVVAALASAGAATMLFVAPALGSDASSSSRRAAAYLAGLQGDDGSVPKGWRADQVAEAIVALAAGGGQPVAVSRAVEHLAKTADAAASSGPYAGRIVAALVVVGRDPRRFGVGGTDFVARIASSYDPVTGSYGGNLYGDTLAMLGQLAAGVTPPDGALTRLRVSQCRDGGWSYQAGCLGKADTDTTSMAVSVLAAVDRTSAEVTAGRAWLLANQRPTGCWGLEAGAVPNANSCGLALSAVAALGEQATDAPWTAAGSDPLADLRGLQLPSGAFQYRKDVAGPNDYATVQALPGLAGWAYPLRVVVASGASGPATVTPAGSVTAPTEPPSTTWVTHHATTVSPGSEPPTRGAVAIVANAAKGEADASIEAPTSARAAASHLATSRRAERQDIAAFRLAGVAGTTLLVMIALMLATYSYRARRAPGDGGATDP